MNGQIEKQTDGMGRITNTQIDDNRRKRWMDRLTNRQMKWAESQTQIDGQ